MPIKKMRRRSALGSYTRRSQLRLPAAYGKARYKRVTRRRTYSFSRLIAIIFLVLDEADHVFDLWIGSGDIFCIDSF